jgi:uncharacterized protein YbjT (DUF2867 family)
MVRDRPLVALTGGTGFVGQMVIEVAQSRGITVKALARRAQAARDHVAGGGRSVPRARWTI